MTIKYTLYNYEGYSFKEGLQGECNNQIICTSYTDYPLFLLLAKFRIWIRFKIINSWK